MAAPQTRFGGLSLLHVTRAIPPRPYQVDEVDVVDAVDNADLPLEALNPNPCPYGSTVLRRAGWHPPYLSPCPYGSIGALMIEAPKVDRYMCFGSSGSKVMR